MLSALGPLGSGKVGSLLAAKAVVSRSWRKWVVREKKELDREKGEEEGEGEGEGEGDGERKVSLKGLLVAS